MSVTVKTLKRKFTIDINGKKQDLQDPNPDFTVDEVVDFYSATYPQIVNSTYTTDTNDKEVVYTFKTYSGSKG